MQVLLTAFDPFGGALVNPALELLRALPDEIGPARLARLELPTVFGRCLELLRERLALEAPDIALGLGLAGGRPDITVERVALNLEDARIPDNAGFQPVDRPVVPGGPPALFATLPIKAMVAAIRAAGVPASVSNTAGTFVCNHLFYGLLHQLAQAHPGCRGGFIHVPFLPEQAKDGAACMELAAMLRGVQAAILAAATVERDSGGFEGSLA